jgi:hypothetical protein
MPYRQATPFAPVVDEILRLTGARRVGPDRYMGHCPLPTHRHGDLRASLSIRKTSDRLLLYCFRGCSSASVLQALGFRWANLSRPLTPDERMHALEERRLQQGALQRQARAERIVADRCRLLARLEDALFERLLVAEGTEADELARRWHSILTLEREADEAWEECLSIFGGTQPRRWRNLFRDEIETGVSTDGMMQRFPLMIWPDTPRLPYVDRAPDQTAIDRAAQVYGDLAALDVKHPLLMRFSPEAQALFVEYNFKLMQRVDCDDLPPAMRAHLAKFESAMPKLAALFALADGAIEEIDLHHARMAAAYCDYLEAHARRAYSPAIDRAKSGAIRLGARLRKGWRNTERFFSIRDVYQHDWTDLKTPEEVRAAVGILVDAGWVREIPVPDDAKAGRPSEQFAINPRLAEVADGSE